MRSSKVLAQKLAPKLSSRLIPKREALDKVRIRDIMVVSPSDEVKEGPSGEFDPKALGYESLELDKESSTFNRIVTKIAEIADIGKKQHFQDKNFFLIEEKVRDENEVEDKSIELKKSWNEKKQIVLNPERLHCITRVITNEFFFYPCKAHGPFQETEFNHLIEKIEKIATEMPENLYLVLATFPIQLSYEEEENAESTGGVFNVAIHVQCGKNSRIDLTVKVTGEDDPTYEEDDYFTFERDMEHNRPSEDLFYETDPLFYESSHGKKMFRNFMLAEKSGGKRTISFSGQEITCITAGGVIFPTVIEICADHTFGITYHTISNNVSLKESTGSGALSERVSYIMVADGSYLRKHYFFTENNVITLVDSHPNGEIIENLEEEIDQPPGIFGGWAIIRIYTPQPLPYFKKEFLDKRIAYNQFLIELESLRHLRAQRPYLYAPITLAIHNLLYTELNKRLALVPKIPYLQCLIALDTRRPSDQHLFRLQQHINTITKLMEKMLDQVKTEIEEAEKLNPSSIFYYKHLFLLALYNEREIKINLGNFKRVKILNDYWNVFASIQDLFIKDMSKEQLNPSRMSVLFQLFSGKDDLGNRIACGLNLENNRNYKIAKLIDDYALVKPTRISFLFQLFSGRDDLEYCIARGLDLKDNGHYQIAQLIEAYAVN